MVELTFDIEPEDELIQYPGDAEVDFARRGLDRVRGALNDLIKDGPFAHYHILEMPERRMD